MATQNYQSYVTRLINLYEGTRYTDGVKPYDPGGPTKYGITLADARLHWKSNATAQDVHDMPMLVALGIYKSKYWDAMWADQLPSGVDGVVTDYGVNSGIGRSGKVLRRVLGLPDNTSKITAEVIAAVAKRDAKAIINAISDERLKFLATLAIYPTYKGGWVKRVNSERAIGTALAAGIPANHPDMPKPVELAPNEVTTKAVIPAPTAAKTVIATGTAGGSGTAAYNWLDWIYDHKFQTGVIAACITVLLIVVIKTITDNHKAKQEAPTPGITVVPELPTAPAVA